MKSDEELIREIMEAGWGSYGQPKPGLIGKLGRMAARQVGKGVGYAAAKAQNAYSDMKDYVEANPDQEKQHAELRRQVFDKLAKDYRTWGVRTTGAPVPVSQESLTQFVHDEYDYNAVPFIVKARAAIGHPVPEQPQQDAQEPQQAAQQAAPAQAAPAQATAKPRARKAAAKKPSAKKPAAQKAEPAPEKKPSDYVPAYGSDEKHQPLHHYLNAYDKDHPVQPRKESLDLSKSFTQIVMEKERDTELQKKFKDAFFQQFGNFILQKTERGINFVRDNKIDDTPPRTNPQAQPKQQQAQPKQQAQSQAQSQAQQQPAAQSGDADPFVKKVEALTKDRNMRDKLMDFAARDQRGQSFRDASDTELAKAILRAFCQAAVQSAKGQ